MIDHETKPSSTDEVLTDVYVLVRDAQGWICGVVHEDVALTLIGLASEDPEDWDEMCSHWPRYRTPPTPRQARALPMARRSGADEETVQRASGWVSIDLVRRRLLTGGRFQVIEPNTIYDIESVGGEQPRNQNGWALPIFLPPWWELEQRVPWASGERRAIDAPRTKPLDRPKADRRLLYGPPLCQGLARRVAAIVQSDAWKTERPGDTRQCYEWIVEAHRDWLMTPREEHGGRPVRDQLHGAHQWLDDLVEGQRTRASEMHCLVARPVPDLFEDTSPMSREEVCEYFDFCRALLEGAFQWVIDAEASCSSALRDKSKLRRALAAAMERVGQEWLTTKQDGLTRHYAREAARRRMPLAYDLPTQGMDDVAGVPVRGVDDCDCPFCKWEVEHAQLTESVAFIRYDGFHLDYDQEFAFSLSDDYDEWRWMYGDLEESA